MTKPISWVAASYISMPSAAEKAIAGDNADKVFGVYRGNGAYAKAIFVWTAPPPGAMIISKNACNLLPSCV